MQLVLSESEEEIINSDSEPDLSTDEEEGKDNQEKVAFEFDQMIRASIEKSNNS